MSTIEIPASTINVKYFIHESSHLLQFLLWISGLWPGLQMACKKQVEAPYQWEGQGITSIFIYEIFDTQINKHVPSYIITTAVMI